MLNIDIGQTLCKKCPRGTYAQEISNAIICETCPAGRTTATEGAASSEECLNPDVNFVFGGILLPVCVVVVFYLLLGRIHDVAELRRKDITLRAANLLNHIYDSLHEEGQREAKEKRIKDTEELKSGRYFSIFFRTWFFFLISALCMVAKAITLFILNVYKIFFSSMIIARSYQRSQIGVNYR